MWSLNMKQLGGNIGRGGPPKVRQSVRPTERRSGRTADRQDREARNSEA